MSQRWLYDHYKWNVNHMKKRADTINRMGPERFSEAMKKLDGSGVTSARIENEESQLSPPHKRKGKDHSSDESTSKKKKSKKKKKRKKSAKEDDKDSVKSAVSKAKSIADLHERDENYSNSDSESDIDLDKEMKPIQQYIKNREEMIHQMFRTIRGRKLKAMLPDVVSTNSLREVRKMCFSELEVMSKKRIRRLLAGDENEGISSSGTEESSDDEPLDVRAKRVKEMALSLGEGVVDSTSKNMDEDSNFVGSVQDNEAHSIVDDNEVVIIDDDEEDSEAIQIIEDVEEQEECEIEKENPNNEENDESGDELDKEIGSPAAIDCGVYDEEMEAANVDSCTIEEANVVGCSSTTGDLDNENEVDSTTDTKEVERVPELTVPDISDSDHTANKTDEGQCSKVAKRNSSITSPEKSPKIAKCSTASFDCSVSASSEVSKAAPPPTAASDAVVVDEASTSVNPADESIEEEEGMTQTQMEILELEMRARAIRAMLRAQELKDKQNNTSQKKKKRLVQPE